MTEPKRILSADEVLYRLDNLSQEFTTAARKATTQAETLALAAQALRAAQEKNLELSRENQNLQRKVDKLEDAATDRSARDALISAAARGDLDTVRKLLERGTEIKVAAQKPAASLLIQAVCRGNREKVQSLLNEGANTNEIPYGDKTTPLMQAAHRGYVEIGRLLIDCGADIEAKDYLGMTALDYAKRINNLGFVLLLEEAAARRLTKASESAANTGLPPLSSYTLKPL